MSTPQRALQRQPHQPRFRKVDSIVEEVTRMQAEVTRRAYEIFSGRDPASGSEVDDWVAAESELLSRPPVDVTENRGLLTIQVAIPGFRPDELDVQVTPLEVLVRSESVREDPGESIVHLAELGRGRAFREIRLPVAIDVDRAEARYRHGMLTITAPLADPAGSGEENAVAEPQETVPETQV